VEISVISGQKSPQAKAKHLVVISEN
jgi:hypothetical protein